MNSSFTLIKKVKYYSLALAIFGLAACGDDQGDSNSSSTNPVANSAAINTPVANSTASGWPDYVAMGTVTQNFCTVNSDPALSCNDEQPHPVDAVFKYAGYNGHGDRGYIPFPGAVNGTLKFVGEMARKDVINQRPVKPVMVQYTANYSKDGESIGTADFSPDNMAKNLINLALLIGQKHSGQMDA
jgi:hypothetical protein